MSRPSVAAAKPSATQKHDDGARTPFNWNVYGLIFGVAAVWLAFAILTGGLFLTGRNISLLLVQSVILAIAALGMMLVMVAGHIDLSVGSAVGLTATVAAGLQSQLDLGIPAMIAVVVMVGLVLGAWQGFWVAVVGVPAFIVTLGGMLTFRGITYVITEGQTLGPVDDALHAFTLMTIGRVPSVILCVLVAAGIIWSVLVQSRNARRRAGMDDGGRFVSDSVPVLLLLALLAWAAIAYQGIPMPAVVVAVLAVVLGLIARHTFYGRRLYAIGDNPESARRVGVNVKAYVFFLFLGMGVIYSLDGIMLAARLNGAPPDPALFLELNAITAVIIGGTSLFGGIGTVRGTLLGAILLGSLANGMQLAGVSTYLQFVVQGLVLVGAVALDTVLKKRRVRG
ncbi:MAG: xylose transporter rane protein [Naasia sp.]|jgi:D-xylose transport system permease protein|uniref:sugar ABC transporter permease n=1 Tax=Naasia sp. TaxID=2546198 RepID=UPI002612C3BF|nr:hypothetical protein [Naasia sp.]MCU1570825.1 xylose transporter rane protein [Naasia sp.]